MISKRASPHEQLDWRWSARYRDLVRYDALQWLALAAFTPCERETWAPLQERSSSEEDQQHLEALMAESRDREILVALGEGREPHLQYPNCRSDAEN